MDKKKKERLAAKGWKVGNATEFLGLSSEEIQFVELKLALSSALRGLRSERGLSQVELAQRLGSSQSRVAKMEASDPSVSTDLLIRGLLAAGASPRDIASAIAESPRKRARRRSP